MKSKLILTLSAFFIFIGFLSAQDEKPFRFGVIGGLNLSNIHLDMEAAPGYHIGVKTEYQLPDNFFLEGSFLFSQKNYKKDVFNSIFHIDHNDNFRFGDLKMKTKTIKQHIEIPIHIGYKLKILPAFSAFASAGGYVAYGLSGKIKTSSLAIYNEETDQMQEVIPARNHDLYGKELDEDRFDYGLGVKAGIELFDRLQFSAGYDWSLNKLYSGLSKDKNQNFMVSCAFMIF